MVCEIDGDLILKLNKKNDFRNPGPNLKQGYNFVFCIFLEILRWFGFFLSAFLALLFPSLELYIFTEIWVLFY